MMRVDPSLAVQAANEIRGIIRRHEIKGVDFSITDITQTNADAVELGAQTLAAAGMSGEAIEDLRTQLRHSESGRVNERLFLTIIERANMIMAGEEEDVWEEATLASANLGAVRAGEKEAREAELEQLHVDFNSALMDEAVTQSQLSAMSHNIWLKEIMHFLRTSASARVPSEFIDEEIGVGR